jgi:hypothetical protein
MYDDELLLDSRIGNDPHYYLGKRGDVLMLVPDEVRKCVVFACYKGESGMRLGGTAFTVGVPSSTFPERLFIHFITAKHVIEEIKKRTVDGNVYLRVNGKGGNPTQFVTTKLENWFYHPSESNVDVAVFPGAVPENIFDYRAITTKMMVTPEVIKREAIGCGDEVFFTGLFVNHVGRERNEPIVRIGNIASMPTGKVKSRTLGLIDAYLIEAKSIGGFSGSPVFVHVGGMRGNSISPSRFFWLGLMHGHFDLEKYELMDGAAEDTLLNLSINMGIAMVIPTYKILEVLNQEAILRQREEIDRARVSQEGATPDVTTEP